MLSLLTSNAPPLGKSVVLPIFVSLKTITVLPPDAPVTVVDNEPFAPLPPDVIENVVVDILPNVLSTPSTKTLTSTLLESSLLKNTKGMGNTVCVTPCATVYSILGVLSASTIAILIPRSKHIF